MLCTKDTAMIFADPFREGVLFYIKFCTFHQIVGMKITLLNASSKVSSTASLALALITS